jgi:hypothetical protein
LNPSVINEVFKPVVPNTNIFAKKIKTGNLICTVLSIQGALSFKMYCQFMEKICVYSHQTSKSGYCCTHTPKSPYQKAVFILQNCPIRRLYSCSKIDISESCIHTPKLPYQKAVFILQNRPIRRLYSYSKIVLLEGNGSLIV